MSCDGRWQRVFAWRVIDTNFSRWLTGLDFITWCGIRYFTSARCGISNQFFVILKWTFFELEGYHSLKVKRPINRVRGVTPFTGLFRPFLDLLQANVFRSSWNFIWYYRSKQFWHNRNTMSFSDIFVHFVDRSVLAVHQAISASHYRKKVVREIFPISWNDEHEERRKRK